MADASVPATPRRPRRLFIDLCCTDLEFPVNQVDAYFRKKENELVLGALIHRHRTHRYEPAHAAD